LGGASGFSSFCCFSLLLHGSFRNSRLLVAVISKVRSGIGTCEETLAPEENFPAIDRSLGRREVRWCEVLRICLRLLRMAGATDAIADIAPAVRSPWFLPFEGGRGMRAGRGCVLNRGQGPNQESVHTNTPTNTRKCQSPCFKMACPLSRQPTSPRFLRRPVGMRF